MTARADELERVEVAHLLTFGAADYADAAVRRARSGTGRSSPAPTSARRSTTGRADFVPVFLSEIPRLIYSGLLPVDVALIHVSPPDEHGFCSYGVGVECTKAAAERARTVIALVNRQMPRSLGDSFIHVTKLTHVVEIDRLPVELARAAEIGEVARGDRRTHRRADRGRRHAADGHRRDPRRRAALPQAEAHLGIHTEMFSDGVVELFESGVITGEAKTLHRGKIVASFVLGTRKTFEFLDNNPFVEFHPSDYVNDPFVIAQNERMVAINSALAVDITGQVCADSIGTRIYSGFGGQVDFIRGAARAKGGKPIIALPSTAKDGAVSRIVDTLAPGLGRGHHAAPTCTTW